MFLLKEIYNYIQWSAEFGKANNFDCMKIIMVYIF